MNFYAYNERGIFTAVVAGQKNPKKQNEFLQPANTTTIAPPEEYSINEVPSFDEDLGQWVLIKSDYKINLDAAKLEEVNEYGVLINEEVNGEVVARPQAEVDAENAEVIAAREAEALIEATKTLKLTMDQNILDKAREITLGTSSESMQAFVQAFSLRANNPEEYINDGLQVHYATAGYALGDPLDTEVKITDYYTKIMVELDKFRNAEIEAYLAAKAAL